MQQRYDLQTPSGLDSAPTGRTITVGEAIERMAMILRDQEHAIGVIVHKISNQDLKIHRLRSVCLVLFGLVVAMALLAGLVVACVLI